MTLCTSWKVTLLESQMLMYVDTLHNLTQAVAADSVNCFDEACAPNPLLMPSMKCFFFKWRGEHGAPESAFTISSRTFCFFFWREGVSVYKIFWDFFYVEFVYLLDSKQEAKFAVAKRQLDSSYFRQTSPKYRKMSHSICKDGNRVEFTVFF